MSKLVIINLGSGDLHQGFPAITAQIWTGERPFPEQFVGSLPANSALIELCRSWQAIYRGLCDRIALRSLDLLNHDVENGSENDLEIDPAGITNVSFVSFEHLCQQLKETLNAWLRSDGFLRIERPLRSLLAPTDDIRLIFETRDIWLWRLPWQQWDLLQDYPRADVALSSPEYRQQAAVVRPFSHAVRVLAILGNSRGIDLRAETEFLKNLPGAESTFLINPSRQEFNLKLWDKRGWDVLFFAGHSQTQGETGRIYINEQSTNNSLTIEQLEEALKAAIENGLKLAIFNSCDGLGLALALEKLDIPAVIVMREPVPNRVAQAFFDYFIEDFVGQDAPLYLSVRRARRKLQGLEDDFPGASWLPVMCQNPATEPPVWRVPPEPEPGRRIRQTGDRTKNRFRHRLKEIGLISLLVTLALILVRFLGYFEPLELKAFDQMMQFRSFLSKESIDNRFLIVEVTEDDIQTQRQSGESLKRVSTTAQTFNQVVDISLSDASLYRLLTVLKPLQPRLIGLDILRDFPVEASQPGLAKLLQQMPIVSVCKAEDRHDAAVPTIDPPPEIPLERIGFNDAQTDSDNVLRRQLLSMSPEQWSKSSRCTVERSFSTQIAFAYLQQEGIAATFIHQGDFDDLQLGDRAIRTLRSHNGGYQQLQRGGGGSQLLLNYRAAAEIARRITLNDLLTTQVNPSYVKDKIVLVGVTAPGDDFWKTPLSAADLMPGVIVQVHMISQILSAALDRRPLIGVWTVWLEIVWVLAWSLTTGILTELLSLRYPSARRLLPRFAIAIAAVTGVIYSVCYLLLVAGHWAPFVPAVFAMIGAGISTAIYTAIKSQSL